MCSLLVAGSALVYVLAVPAIQIITAISVCHETSKIFRLVRFHVERLDLVVIRVKSPAMHPSFTRSYLVRASVTKSTLVDINAWDSVQMLVALADIQSSKRFYHAATRST